MRAGCRVTYKVIPTTQISVSELGMPILNHTISCESFSMTCRKATGPCMIKVMNPTAPRGALPGHTFGFNVCFNSVGCCSAVLLSKYAAIISGRLHMNCANINRENHLRIADVFEYSHLPREPLAALPGRCGPTEPKG